MNEPKDMSDNDLFTDACACVDELQMRGDYDYIQQIAEYAMAAKLNDLGGEDDTRCLEAIGENDYPS